MSNDDFEPLRCTFPGCNTTLAESAAWLPRIEAIAIANNDEPVKIADLRRFCLCGPHGKKCQERGIRTFRFEKTRKMLETHEAENQARNERKNAAAKAAEADELKNAEKTARKREREDTFFGQFTPKPTIVSVPPSDLEPRRPERTRARA